MFLLYKDDSGSESGSDSDGDSADSGANGKALGLEFEMENEAGNNMAGIPRVILEETLKVPAMNDSDGSASDPEKGS